MPGIHDGHRKRMRARFLREGLDHFEPHNVLELLLFYAFPQRDTNELAHLLIARFGSLSAVFEASFEELCAVKGIGETSATLIKLIPDLARRYMDETDASGLVLESVEAIGTFLMPKFIGRTKEYVFLLCLDNKGAAVYADFIAEGSINTAPIYTRSILEVVMRTHAVAVVLAHNHPHGIAIPSNADLVATQTVGRALAAAHVRMIDHFIFAGNDYVSLRDSGFFDFENA